jgi:hypothetical protein
MYDNFPAGPLIIPGGGPPVAYFNRGALPPPRPGYMNAAGQIMYPERPGMPPRISTDTAMVSTRRRPRPSSLIGTPVVTYDVNTGPKVSARRTTGRPLYIQPEPEPEPADDEETEESFDEEEESEEEEGEEEEEFEEEEEDYSEDEESEDEVELPQPNLGKGGDALRQMLAGLDQRVEANKRAVAQAHQQQQAANARAEANKRLIAQAQAEQQAVKARAAQLKAEEDSRRALMLAQAQAQRQAAQLKAEDDHRRALKKLEEEEDRRIVEEARRKMEEDKRQMPPPNAPASGSKYSMRNTSKPTHITYGNTPTTTTNDDDFEDLRETIRNLGAHGATTQRRPSLAGSSDRTKASSYSYPSSSGTKVTVEHPTRGRRVSYVGSESRAELQQSLQEMDEYMAARAHHATGTALRHKPSEADFNQLIQKAVADKLREMNLDHAATKEEEQDKLHAALAYQRQLERELNPFLQQTPLTESALRRKQGLPSETSQQSSNEYDAGTRISAGHRLTAPVSERGGVSISGDELRMRIDPASGFEVEFEGRRLALNPTGDGGMSELVISGPSGRREAAYHSTKGSTITMSKYGDTKSRAGGNKTSSSDRSATTVEDDRRSRTGVARLRQQLERDRQLEERKEERKRQREEQAREELERQELEREEHERERQLELKRLREERERVRAERERQEIERVRLREERERAREERERLQQEELDRKEREEREERQRERQRQQRQRHRERDRSPTRTERAFDDYDSDYTRTGQMRRARNTAAATRAAAAAAAKADARYAPGPEVDDYPPPRAASARPRYTGPGYPGFPPQGFPPGYGTANSSGLYGA